MNSLVSEKNFITCIKSQATDRKEIQHSSNSSNGIIRENQILSIARDRIQKATGPVPARGFRLMLVRTVPHLKLHCQSF